MHKFKFAVGDIVKIDDTNVSKIHELSSSWPLHSGRSYRVDFFLDDKAQNNQHISLNRVSNGTTILSDGETWTYWIPSSIIDNLNKDILRDRIIDKIIR
jgi:hypothetical protein